MHILIATGIYPPEIGGPATYTVLLEKELPAYGHTTAVLPFRVSTHLPKVFRHIDYTWKLYKKAKTADVIFAQDVVSVGLPALVVAKLRRKIFLVRVPGDYAWEQSVQRYNVEDAIDDFQKKKYGLRIELLRFIQSCVTRYAHKVITPSNYFRDVVAGWGVPKEHIITIYNGVDVTVDPSVVERPAAFTVVSAGRLVPWKGFETLFRIIKDNPEWQLVILGDGPDRVRYETILRQEGISHRVHIKGAVSRPDIFGWCKAADVFVLNTEFESFSYQIVEAMSVGAAIITTLVGSIPELITNGVEGVLVAPHNREHITAMIDSVTKEPEVWAIRKQAAKDKATLFSVSHTVAALHAVLKTYE